MANTTGKKYGGRKSGTPNKSTTLTRDFINNFISENFGVFCGNFELLEPKDKANVYVKMLDFVLPKMKSVEVTDSTKRGERIDDIIKKLSESGDG